MSLFQVKFYNTGTEETTTLLETKAPVDVIILDPKSPLISNDNENNNVDNIVKPENMGKPQFVYYLSGGSLIKANKANPNDKEAVSRIGGSKYVIDPKRKILFYVSFNRNIVQESLVDGRKKTIVSGVGNVGDLKLNKKANVLYYTDSIKGEIRAYKMNEMKSSVVYSGLSNPTTLQFDPLGAQKQ